MPTNNLTIYTAMKYILPLFLRITFITAYSQSPPLHSTLIWNPINSAKDAAYYRTIEQKAGSYLVRDYYISGEIEMEAPCSAVTPILIKDGKATWYLKMAM